MERYYSIGGHLLKIEGDEADSITRFPGFAPFETNRPEAEPGMRMILTGCDTVASFAGTLSEGNRRPQPFAVGIEKQSVFYRFAFDEINCTFAGENSGKYVFQMCSPDGQVLELCCRPDSGKCTFSGSKSPRLLRFALWVGYGLLAAAQQTLCMHASVIVCRGKAVLFLGESGTGKSTHTRLWQEHVPGVILLNDDSPVVRICGDLPFVYGSPWSGKTPCYRNERAELAAVVRLSQAPYNRIRQLKIVEAFGALFPSCPPAFARDKILRGHVCSILSKVLCHIPVYHLACLPDAEAVRLSFRTLF